ncbi:MAG: DEAD/DEAH box helicase family protein [Saprospiraceae bacterium]|nr:DEAD/DEAH box helicase family protein [Saprospiraceae bacterium]
MNEAETRAELIDPKLRACGWGVVEGSRILREYNITAGKIQTGGRGKMLTADYILVYKGIKLAVIEAKSNVQGVGEGVAQAKQYAQKMQIETCYATNGTEIYSICMKSGAEGVVQNYLTPDELWDKTFSDQNVWRDLFNSIPYEDKSGTWQLRYYQELAVKNTMEAIAKGKQRILLTLATGTGKTAIAFQIAWKLFQTRWNLQRDGSRRPRILFLADRNILANQAYNSFSSFPEDALIRIKPGEIRRQGRVPTNGSIFFTIFQTFMSSTGSDTNLKTRVVESVETDFREITEIEVGKQGYAYISLCADGSFYTGSTNNLQRRIEEHKSGVGAKFTKEHSFVKLVYYETFNRIDKAFEREKQIQGWSRAKKIALITGDIELLRQLSKNKIDKDAKVVERAEAFGEYAEDYFDFIIVDECHRGGAKDESNWRSILEYFSPAVQLGLTATPKRNDNVDTYRYFGEPVFVYSLKEGINDGFLTPFKVKRIKTTLDDYIYTNDDDVLEGEIEQGKLYKEGDFNRIIEIKEREANRVKIYMNEANQNEKAIIFCATQDHAAAVRDLVNQYKKSSHPNYCVRVTANDGEIGEQFLREFQDNEKTIPTILTTSQKLSTGVDARNIRNIVLMRPVNSMIEFKQIVGRGTRMFDGKEFFTIYDYVDAYHHFADPEWDGEPAEPEPDVNEPPVPYDRIPPIKPENDDDGNDDNKTRKKIKVKLKDGKEREIQHMIATSFWSADGKPVSAQEFMENLFGKLPELFQSESELRTLWSHPMTRRTLLQKLDEAGFSKDDLHTLQKLVNLEKSDLFDVLEYVFNADIKTMTREERVNAAQSTIFAILDEKQREFISFVLSKYVESGVDELDQEKLPTLLQNKYQSLEDAKSVLGEVKNITALFMEFQKHLYEGVA